MEGVKKSIIQGGAWMSIGRILQVSVQIITSIIMARLLAPEVFGQYGMIMVFSGFSLLFMDPGLSPAIIQSKTIQGNSLSSIFWFHIIIAFFLTLALNILAPLIADFYEVSSLQIYINAVSLIFLLTAVSSVPEALIKKQLQFRTITIITLFSVISSNIIGIILAYTGWGLWSLIGQLLLLVGIKSLFVLMYSKWIPKMHFRWVEVKQVLPFGFNVFGGGLISYWGRNLDDLLIGKVLGSSQLGIYTKAYGLLLLPQSNITTIVNQVLFPSFASIQDDLQQIKRIYLKAIQLISFITAPLMLGVFVMAEPIILMLLGKQWSEMIPLVKVFSILSIFQSVLGTTGNIFLSRNRPDIIFRLSLITNSILFVALIFSIQFGLMAVVYCILITSLVFAYFQLYLAGKLIELRVSEVLRAVFPIFLYSLIGTVLGYAIDFIFLFDLEYIFRIVCFYILSGLGIIALNLFFNLKRLRDFSSIIRKQLGSAKAINPEL